MELMGFWLMASIVVGIIASGKGRSFLGWTLLATLISPLLAGLLILVSGSKK